MLFPEPHEQQKLADLLSQHYYSQTPTLKRLAHRFIANLCLDWRDLRALLDKILTKDFAEKALRTLSLVTGGNSDLEEQIDFLFILLGRVLHIEEIGEVGDPIETEIRQIVQGVYPAFTSVSDETIRAAALDILRYLPLRTENEITYALDLANKTTEQQVQAAIAFALKEANPQTPTAKQALEVGQKSSVEVVREAVKKRLEELK